MAPPRKREMTATEQLAALKEREAVTDGYLIPPPANLYEALDEPHSCPERSSGLRCCCRVRAWLKEVSEVGGGENVDIAWVRGVHDSFVKSRLLGYYEQTRREAGMRHVKLQERAAAEYAAERVAYLERTAKADRERRIARLEAEVAKLRAG